MLLSKSLRHFASFKKFDYTDPLRFKTLLSEEEIMIMDNAHQFAQSYLMPRIIKDYREQHFDRSILKKIGENGYLGCTLNEYGAPGITHTAQGLINRELDRVDSGYGTTMGVQNSLVIFPIYNFAQKQIKDKYLPGLISGNLLGCFGLTEPDNGSDPGSMKSRAKLEGNQYVLNGSKMWITHAPMADVFVVWAKDDNGDLRGFVLQKGMKGLSSNKIRGKMSLHVSITGDIVMDNVRVPKSHMLQVKGLSGPFQCLNKSRMNICWGAMGVAEFCFHKAREYVLERKQFGVPLAAFQLVQHKLAQMSVDISLGTLGILQVSRLSEKGQLASEMISMMKRNNCMKAIQIARDAREMLGGNGITQDYHVLRHAINLETVNTYEGTNDVHALIIGRAITGIQSFTRSKPT